MGAFLVIIFSLIFGFMLFGVVSWLMFQSPRVAADGLTYNQRCRRSHDNIFRKETRPTPTPSEPLTGKALRKQQWQTRKRF